MFASKPKAPAIPELVNEQEVDQLFTKPCSIVFKHSPTCLISRVAHLEVERFLAKQPDAPIYMVSVRRQREVSRYIAERTGVEHESPQIVVLRHGKVVASASHEEITAGRLQDLFRQESEV